MLEYREASSYGMHLSSTNFFTISSVFLAFSLTLLAAYVPISMVSVAVGLGAGNAYNQRNLVRHIERFEGFKS